MKTVLFLIFSSIPLFMNISEKVNKANKNRVQIEVKINGIETIKGTMLIALYGVDNEFPSKTDVFDYRHIPVNGKKMSTTFKVMEAGYYAFAVQQDINNNGKMDKNLFGYPKEPFGFSNNPIVHFSAPDFDQCAVNVLESMTIEIDL
jgi:uncharacterized protein (DUF2141 family)